MTRLEFVSETLRAALNRIAIVEPEWLKAFAPADWYGRYGERAEQGRLLRRFKDKQTLTDLVGTVGMAFLSAVYNGNAPDVLRTLPEVDVLRRCWLEQFYVDDGKAKLRTRRISSRVRSASTRLMTQTLITALREVQAGLVIRCITPNRVTKTHLTSLFTSTPLRQPWPIQYG